MMDLAPISYCPSPSRPTLRLPKGAWDAHCHVFGPVQRFPYAPTRSFTPGEAPKERLFAMHALIGVEHAVIVQSGVHGFDNSAAIEALLAKGGAYRGVALLPPEAEDRELSQLSAIGFCGVRFNFMKHLGAATPVADILHFAHRLADHGWHLQLHLDAALIEELAPALKRSPVPVVIDHMGRIDASRGLDQPDFQNLLRLLDDERFWVKVSGCERSSRQGAPYDDAVPFAAKLVAACGERTLWGTDWPHPNVPAPAPDDGALTDLLARIAPGEAALRALLVDNPNRLYRRL